MKDYNYNPVTKEFTGSTDSSLDPLESKTQEKKVYLCPLYATHIKPPGYNPIDNQIPVFDEDTQSWKIEIDMRDKKYYDKNGEEFIITQIGEVNEIEKYTTVAPPAYLHEPLFHNNKWIESAKVFQRLPVEFKEEVDKITRQRLSSIGDIKAIVEKLKAGSGPCKVWDDFIIEREKILKEGNDFIAEQKLS